MKKILLGVALLGAASTAALAADLPSRRAPPVYIPPVAPAPVFTWTGFYGGLNAGYAFDADSNFSNAGRGVSAGRTPVYLRNRTDGFTGGGQVGYNIQLGNTPLPLLGALGNGGAGGGLVLGVEADAAYTDLSKSTLYGGTGLHSRLAYLGTARGRVGYAFGDLLIYGTGGFAYGEVHNALAAGSALTATSSTRTGYTYGGGIEYAIPTASFVNFLHSSAVTLKVEYLHYDLGSQSIAVGNGARGFTSNVKTDGNLVRAGINYKLDLFGSPVAPVVARY